MPNDSDAFGSLIRSTYSGHGPGGQKPSDEAKRDSRFIPITPLPVIAFIALGMLPTSLDDSPATTALLDTIHSLRWVLIVVIAVAVIADVFRIGSFRQRRVLRTQLWQTLRREPKALRLIPGIGGPFRATVRMPIGTVLTDRQRTEFKNEVVRWFDREYDLDYKKSVLVLTRTARAETSVQRSERHNRLAAVTGDSGPLSGSTIAVQRTDDDGTESSYRISYPPNLRTAHENWQTQVSEALIAYAGQSDDGRVWATDWHPEANYVDLYLLEALPTYIATKPYTEEGYRKLLGTDQLAIPFATGRGGKVAYWNISPKTSVPHSLIVGPTGGGKTSVIRTLVVGGCNRGVNWFCADPKMIELVGLENFPGVRAVTYDIHDIVSLISALHAEMLARYKKIKNERLDPSDFSPIGLVLDEFFIMSAAINRIVKRKVPQGQIDEEKEFIVDADPLGKIAELLALSRSANMRISVGVQRPDASIFGDAGGSARDNFRTRCSLGRLSLNGAMMMWDDADVGRNVDESIPGRAIVADAAGNPMDGQVWWTPDVDRHPNKWNKLSEADKAIVETLTPKHVPEVGAYSAELRAFLEQRPARPAATEATETSVAELDDINDAIPAREITTGQTVRIDVDGDEITAQVAEAKRTRRGVTVTIDTDSRGTTTVELDTEELVYLVHDVLV